MTKQEKWRENLTDVFHGFINQGVIDDGVSEMLWMGIWKVEYHKQWLEMIDQARRAISERDPFILTCINDSGGYMANDFEMASSLIERLATRYLEAYSKEATSGDAE